MLRHAVTKGPVGVNLGSAVGTAAFLGRRFHGSIIKQLGTRATRLAPRTRVFPESSPASLMGGSLVEARRRGLRKRSDDEFRQTILDELNDIANRARDQGRRPGVMERYRAIAFDCFLYAKGDQYATEREPVTQEEGDAQPSD
jgi:hypothetical protein